MLDDICERKITVETKVSEEGEKKKEKKSETTKTVLGQKLII